MKRIITIFLVVVLLSACGASKSSKNNKTNDTQNNKKAIEIEDSQAEEPLLSEHLPLRKGCTAYKDDELYYTEEYSYDDHDRLIKTVRTYKSDTPLTDDPIMIYAAEYDDFGNKSFELSFSYLFREQSHYTAYSYKYDEKGNWTKREQVNYEGIPGPDSVGSPDTSNVTFARNEYNGEELVSKEQDDDTYVEYEYSEDGGYKEYYYSGDELYKEECYDAWHRLLYKKIGKTLQEFEYNEKGDLIYYYIQFRHEQQGIVVYEYSIKNKYDEMGLLSEAYYESKNENSDLKMVYEYDKTDE